MNKDIVQSLKQIANSLELMGMFKEASQLDSLTKESQNQLVSSAKKFKQLLEEEGGADNVINALKQMKSSKLAFDAKKIMRIVALAALLLGTSTQAVIAKPDIIKQTEQQAEDIIQSQINQRIQSEIYGLFRKKPKKAPPSPYEVSKAALTLELLNTTKARYKDEETKKSIAEHLKDMSPKEIQEVLENDMGQFVFSDPGIQKAGWPSYSESFLPWFKSTSFYREVDKTIQSVINSVVADQQKAELDEINAKLTGEDGFLTLHKEEIISAYHRYRDNSARIGRGLWKYLQDDFGGDRKKYDLWVKQYLENWLSEDTEAAPISIE